MSDLQVEYRKLAALTPHPRNPRTHSKRQIRQIADSIRCPYRKFHPPEKTWVLTRTWPWYAYVRFR